VIVHDPRPTVEALAAELAVLDWAGGARIFPGPLYSLVWEAHAVSRCSHCQKHAGFALDFAAQSRDLILMKLLGLALMVMCPQGWACGVPADGQADERRRRGAGGWWRVWAHLAAIEHAEPCDRPSLMIEPDGRTVPILNKAPLGPGDREAWIMAALFASPDPHEASIPDTPFLDFARQSGDTSKRTCRLSPVKVERFLAAVAAHAGEAWVLVRWGEGGITLDVRRMAIVPVGDVRHRWFVKLPTNRAAARARVRSELQKVQDAVRLFLRRSDRRRLDDYATELAVYLLRHGHGALRPRTEKQTFARLYKNVYTGDSYEDSLERRAIRADYIRARRLIAAPPGQPAG
jgi:hypothetical protein